MFTTFIFDLDDTLINTSDAASQAWQDLCCAHAPALGLQAAVLNETISQVRHGFWQDPAHQHLRRLQQEPVLHAILQSALHQLGVHAPATAHTMANAFDQAYFGHLKLFAGTTELLMQLRASGYRLGMITNGNGQRQRRKIERFELAPHFGAILVEEEFGAGKPDERVYWHTLGQLNSTPHEAWMIGDKLHLDVLPPQKLGLTGVWVDVNGAGVPADIESQPNFVVRRVAELAQLLALAPKALSSATRAR